MMRLPTMNGLSSFAHLRTRPKAAAPNDDKEREEDDEREAGDEEDKKKNKKTKKGKADDERDQDDEDDDEEDERDEEDPKARAARRREKCRIRAITSSAAGKRMPAVALRLALDTSMPRGAAIQALAAMASETSRGAGHGLYDRMGAQKLPVIGPGGDDAPSLDDPSGIAAAIIMAGKKRRGELG